MNNLEKKLEAISLDEIASLKKSIHVQLKYGTLLRMEEYSKEHNLNSISATIERLTDIALILDEHKEKLDDHPLLKEIEEQFKEGGLVDYFAKMNPSDFNIMRSIVMTEFESRKKDKKR